MAFSSNNEEITLHKRPQMIAIQTEPKSMAPHGS